ncbi:EscU/YscU/HrcU family type III secretion system export apparatus switch protein [Novosphingobium lentum]|uniref:EscU/YscU/HrcU family type III secretion system export apparatus switch protein n=1 Tax=Novosphingobium lentum TaxID=145287 RepID=UPI00083107BF|nr:flagellar type III secretion system protein FlhB [Novosphingobium lentum]
MSEDSGEKTFAPTEKRKTDAAKNGDVLRSRELATAVGMMVGAVWLRLAGPWMLSAMSDTLRTGLTWDRSAIEDFSPGRTLLEALKGVLPPLLVLGVLVPIAVVGSQLGFSNGKFLPANLAPKASRINPLSGLKRVFGTGGWIELAKGLAKLVLLGTIAYEWARGRVAGLIGLGAGPVTPQLAFAWDTITSLLFALGSGLVLIAMIDFPIQFVRRFFRLRMSHQELRDESKEAEGSPEKKAAIRGRQRQLALGGVHRAMAEAQFVITNPTHFAVAMAYDPLRAQAPIVLAKGRGEKALAMRELAAERALPVLEYPALARSVYFTTRENQVIREELYGAVAAVLAFVLSLKRGDHVPPPLVEVPTALRFDAEGRPDARKAA